MDHFLVTERLGFREWREDDVDLAVRLWGNPDVTRFIAKAPLERAEIEARLAREIESQRQHGIQYWPMFLRANDSFVGCAGLRPWKPDMPELGAHVLPEHWRRGYALEACRAVIDRAFANGAHALFAGHNPENDASRSMLRALGFRWTHDEPYAATGLMHPSYRLDVHVRRVIAKDVPAVIDLVRDTLAEFGLEFGKGAKTDDELAHLPGSYDEHGGAFWVAVREGEMLGTAGVFPVAPSTLELRKMYLRPASRGLGLGKRLLDEALRFAKKAGAERMVLDTTHQMTRAIEFYESNGFVRDDSEIRGARCSRGYKRDL
jgi:RimJ/RimL family protein N-acetyltransferase